MFKNILIIHKKREIIYSEIRSNVKNRQISFKKCIINNFKNVVNSKLVQLMRRQEKNRVVEKAHKAKMYAHTLS